MSRVVTGRTHDQRIKITVYSEEECNNAIQQFHSEKIYDIEISKEQY